MSLKKESVIVITGASSGIGKETALELAKRGSKLVLASRNRDLLENLARQVEGLGGIPYVLPCDVSRQADCTNMISKAEKHFGHIDVLINNAGYGHYAAVENLDTQDLEKIFRTNLYGSLWCTQAALPKMKNRRSGHIVNVSTVISKRSIPFMTAYCMTKFAMNAMDEGLRLEVRPHGIDVTLFCPGLTKTQFQTNAGRVGTKAPVSNEKGMSSKKVARILIASVERKKRRVSLTWSGRIMLALQRVSPSLVDEVVYHFMAKRAAKNF